MVPAGTVALKVRASVQPAFIFQSDHVGVEDPTAGLVIDVLFAQPAGVLVKVGEAEALVKLAGEPGRRSEMLTPEAMATPLFMTVIV